MKFPVLARYVVRNLLKYFGSVERMKKAGVEELVKAPGMTKGAAQAVYDHLRAL